MRKDELIQAERPVCIWVPVSDADGRTHMEARWTTAASLARSAAA